MLGNEASEGGLIPASRQADGLECGGDVSEGHVCHAR